MPGSIRINPETASPADPYPKRRLFPKPVLDEFYLFQTLDGLGLSRAHAATIWKAIALRGVRALAEIPGLPPRLASTLADSYAVTTSRVIKTTEARDRTTTKLLVELQDGKQVEAVIMRYGDVAFDSFPADQKLLLEQRRKDRLERWEAESRGEAGSDTASLMSSGTAQSSVLDREFKSKKRATLCVSSQVGCAMACTFCATGTMGLTANLSAGEIIELLIHANDLEPIRNIVFMGMGEPLDNYSAVLGSIRAFVDTKRFGLSPQHVCVSTVGVIPRMKQLMMDAPDISLALSLHAPNQRIREEIVPTSKAWKIEAIMAAADLFVDNQNERIRLGANRLGLGMVKKDTPTDRDVLVLRPNMSRKKLERIHNRESRFLESVSPAPPLDAPPTSSEPPPSPSRPPAGPTKRQRHVLIEYVLIRNVNSQPEVAHELGALLSTRSVLLNVIPYNPTPVPHDYAPPTPAEANDFVRIVREHGVKVLFRQTLGSDVGSACGQLVIASQKKAGPGSNAASRPATAVDMEDLMTSPAPSRPAIAKAPRAAPPLAHGAGGRSDAKVQLRAPSSLTRVDWGWALVLGALLVALVARIILKWSPSVPVSSNTRP